MSISTRSSAALRFEEEDAREVARASESVTRKTTDERVIDRLREIERLKVNWDGEGSAPPTREVVCFARIIWGEIRDEAQRKGIPLALPSVAAFPNGVVGLNWVKDRKNLVELNVRGPDDFEVFAVRGGREASEDIESTVSAMTRVLYWLPR